MMDWKSVGMMTFPTEWKNNPNGPNHQPDNRWFDILDSLHFLDNLDGLVLSNILIDSNILKLTPRSPEPVALEMPWDLASMPQG